MPRGYELALWELNKNENSVVTRWVALTELAKNLPGMPDLKGAHFMQLSLEVQLRLVRSALHAAVRAHPVVVSLRP